MGSVGLRRSPKAPFPAVAPSCFRALGTRRSFRFSPRCLALMSGCSLLLNNDIIVELRPSHLLKIMCISTCAISLPCPGKLQKAWH